MARSTFWKTKLSSAIKILIIMYSVKSLIATKFSTTPIRKLRFLCRHVDARAHDLVAQAEVAPEPANAPRPFRRREYGRPQLLVELGRPFRQQVQLPHSHGQ